MKPSDRRDESNGPFSYEGLERVLHEKARLGILSSLLANPGGLIFTELKELCSLTDGNLSRHLQALQEAGLIEVQKRNSGRRSQTLVRLTTEGRERFLDYVNLLEKIVRQTLESAKSETRSSDQRWGLDGSPA